MIHFLSGLPRSGSTLLAAILNQHPQVYASPTSGLIDIMGAVCMAWEQNPTTKAQGQEKDYLYALLRKLLPTDEQITIDKSRGWVAPQIMATMGRVLGSAPKIVATVRSVPDCAASFVRVAKPDDVTAFLRQSHLIEHLKTSYVALQKGYEAAPENFCFIEYDDLLTAPQKQMDRIHSFLGLEQFTYDFNAIDGAVVAEKDEEAWGVKGLHDVKLRLEKQHQDDSRVILGQQYNGFLQPAFWRGEKAEDRPPQLIDLQLEAASRGDWEKGWEISQMLEAANPDDDRAAYNRGLYLLRQGKLQEGHALLSRGRAENAFGNPPPPTPTSLWDGHSRGTVLLNLEGGRGDQIHQIRFAQEISRRAGKCIVQCMGELVPLFQDVEGVAAVMAYGASGSVYHDAWVPGMSAPLCLGGEADCYTGVPYIARTPKRSGKFTVGLRWQGNLRFEKDHKKAVPHAEFFSAVQSNYWFVSLQRDQGAEERPAWVEEMKLDTWLDTRDAISQCDLVISTCTSVAHLSGAMGIPTWVLSPILPYYIWAVPGETSTWYDSVRLFRQTVFRSWQEPFAAIKAALAKRVVKAA